jgi:hypothetical protein
VTPRANIPALEQRLAELRQAELDRVTRAADALEAAQAELDAAVGSASDAGLSIRAIANAARMSFEWTRRRLLTRDAEASGVTS